MHMPTATKPQALGPHNSSPPLNDIPDAKPSADDTPPPSNPPSVPPTKDLMIFFTEPAMSRWSTTLASTSKTPTDAPTKAPVNVQAMMKNGSRLVMSYRMCP